MVVQNVVEALLQDSQCTLKNYVTELLAPKNPLLHFLKLYILEAKDALRVVVSDGCSLHLTNLHLHYVFKETTTDEVIVLPLER